jgi:hypothetical protein
MVRGDLVKLFLTLETKSLVRSTRESFRSQFSVGCSDGMAHKYAFMRSPPASFSVCERHATAPGAGREVDLEEGDAEVYSGKRHRSRSNSALPAFALLRPAGRLFPCPSGGATEQPQHQSSPRRLIKRTAERQVWRTVMCRRAACDAVEILRQRRKPRFAL